jgi:MFS family permease
MQTTSATAQPAQPVELGKLLRTLSLPTFGLALAVSVLTTYAPVLLGKMTTSGTAIGLAVGAEGLFALFLPLVIGPLSDRTRTRFGRRIPYAVFGAPLLALPLAILPFSSSYAVTVGLISLFFVGYYVYYPPYQALFPELVPASSHGRAQGAQGVARGLGLGAALVGGGLLLTVWAPLPFILAAGAIVLTTVALVTAVREPVRQRPESAVETVRRESPKLRRVLRETPGLSSFLVANALWELSFMGLKTFIVLYVVRGLGESTATASAVIGVVAASYVIASFASGRLGDRIGILRLLRGSLWIYGAGLIVAAAATSLSPLLVGLPLVALAGAVLMTLPYGLLMKMTPPGVEGAVTGLFSFSRGVGAILGPILVGTSIDLGRPLFESTGGYGAMWIAVGVPILLSLAFLPKVRSEARAKVLKFPRPAEPADAPATAVAA